MNKILVASLVLLTLMASCKKDGNNTPASSFLINGIGDMSIQAYGTGSLPLEIKHVEGTQESVELTVTGLPAGVTHSFVPANGTPTYTSILTLTGSAAVPGTYAVKVKGTSSSFSKEYSFNLTVTKTCAAMRAGLYFSTNSCDADTATLQIADNPTTNNQIFIKNPQDTLAGQINANVDCATNTLVIPSQSINGMIYSGTGSFTDNTLTMNVTFSLSGVTNNCTVYLTRK